MLDPAGRDVSDVSHSISAVASRDIAKAEQFIADFAPKGACAQISGQVKELPVAVGSYEELVSRNVSYIPAFAPKRCSLTSTRPRCRT